MLNAFSTPGDIATWTSSTQEYFITGVNVINFNKRLNPNNKTLITPRLRYIKDDYNHISMQNISIQTIGPNWDNTFELSFAANFSRDGNPIKDTRGVLYCDICMAVDGFVHLEFDIKKFWDITASVTYGAMTLIGTPSVRYLYPRFARLAFVRILFLQGFEILGSLIPEVKVSVSLRGRVIRVDRTDLKVQDGDQFTADVSVKVEDEWAQISLEGFE